MKAYEIYEKKNRLNQITVVGKTLREACKKAGLDSRKFRVVSWGWVE